MDSTICSPILSLLRRWHAVIDVPVSIEQERAFVDVLRADERLTDVAGQLYTEAAIGET